MEALLIEKIASCLATKKAVQAESSLFHKGLSNEWSCKSHETFFQGREGDCLQNFSRYEANFYRALHQLKELQEARMDVSLDSFLNRFVW